MAAEFGGTPYRYVDGEMVQLPTEGVLKGMLHAFVPGGSDSTDDAYANVAGNTLGSWVFRINYNADRFKAAFYADHFLKTTVRCFFSIMMVMERVLNGVKRRKDTFLCIH